MLIGDVADFLRHVPPFQFVDEETLDGIATSARMEYCPKGTLVLKQDGPPSEYLYIIKKGGVKILRRSADGNESVLDFRGEGDLFGYLSLFGGDKSRATVIAMEDTLCYVLERSTAKRLMETNESVREYFLKSFFSLYIDKAFQEMHSRSLFFAGGGDRMLFSTAVGEICTREVVTAPQTISIKEAAGIMCENNISSLVLVDDRHVPVGIVTDRDLRGKVIAKGRALGSSVKGIMSYPILRVEARDFCFEALMKMIKHNVHHLIVVKDGEMRGMLTNHDFLVLQGTSPLLLAKDIQSQQSIEGLSDVARQVNNIVGILLKQGAKASNISRIITEINDRIAAKVLGIAERKFGAPPVAYCWLGFGYEGRKEQTFKTDQNNALIYEDATKSPAGGRAEAYFQEFTRFVVDGLAACGFPPSAAGHVASNPLWRQPLSVWKRYFSEWIATPTAEAAFNAMAFFDFRGIHGDLSMAEELRTSLFSGLRERKTFLRAVANLAVRNRPPIGFLKTFVVEKTGEHKDKLNLEIKGIAPLVDAVRLFALEGEISETSTLERIDALRGHHYVINEYGADLAQAFEFFMLLNIQHQFEQLGGGAAPDDFINPESLSNLQKKTMREAFGLLDKIQDGIMEQDKQVVG